MTDDDDVADVPTVVEAVRAVLSTTCVLDSCAEAVTEEEEVDVDVDVLT